MTRREIDNILLQEPYVYDGFDVYDEDEDEDEEEDEDDGLSAYARYTRNWDTREDDAWEEFMAEIAD